MEPPSCIVDVVSYFDDDRTRIADYVTVSPFGVIEARIWDDTCPPRFERVLGIFADLPSARKAIHFYRVKRQQLPPGGR
jgi:hypothetical protein